MVTLVEVFSVPLLNLGLLLGAFVLLLGGAEIFTNSVEWFGYHLGVSWGTIRFLKACSAVLALVGGGLVLLRTQFLSTNRMRPAPFLVAGVLYLVFIAVVTYHVVVLDVSAGG